MTEQVNPAPRLDNQDPALFGQTPSQTVGPFFHYGLPWKGGADLVGQSDMGARPELFPEANYVLNLASPKGLVSGETIILEGVVYDANGAPVPDAMIEIWQANAAGRYASPDDDRPQIALDEGFIGFGRASTSEEGLYRFKTVLPGAVPGPGNSPQAPHIAVSVFGRGLLKRLVTRVYFDGQAANAVDPILALVPAERRETLIARKIDDAWRFNIVLQGVDETVFFDV
jgi:protocatechuate 3,4-dioxygenase alpha subunit